MRESISETCGQERQDNMLLKQENFFEEWKCYGLIMRPNKMFFSFKVETQGIGAYLFYDHCLVRLQMLSLL